MLTRQLEPEVMDTAEDARDYDAMDHRSVNAVFVGDFLSLWSSVEKPFRSGPPLQILDVGTGTALIPIELCRRKPDCRVIAIDLASEMLNLAEVNITRAGLNDSIRTRLVDAKSSPFRDGEFDAVMSNSIVHHIPQPRAVFADMVRVLRPGGLLFVRDLLRPDSSDEVERLVATYAGQENAHSQQLFRQSLHAALSLSEVQRIILELGITGDSVWPNSDRHWTLAWRKPC